MQDITKAKQLMRKSIRIEGQKHSLDDVKSMSLSVNAKILNHPRIQNAKTVMMFYSLLDEIYTHELVDILVQKGKKVLLPKVISETEMTIHGYESQSDITKGAYGIMEPNTPSIPLVAKHDASEDDVLPREFVCITPGMAFDKDGNRLGRGKGYYDRFFKMAESKGYSIYKMGVCLPYQFVDEVPSEPSDIKVDEVLH